MDLTWLARLLPGVETVWRKIRYKGRARLELDWTGAGYVLFDGPNQLWRTVNLIVTASRDEDFVLARGVIEARPEGAKEWSVFCPLEEALSLPKTVPKNLEGRYRIEGAFVAKGLRVALPGVASVSVRVRVEDYHRVRLLTDPLDVELVELERTEFR